MIFDNLVVDYFFGPPCKCSHLSHMNSLLPDTSSVFLSKALRSEVRDLECELRIPTVRNTLNPATFLRRRNSRDDRQHSQHPLDWYICRAVDDRRRRSRLRSLRGHSIAGEMSRTYSNLSLQLDEHIKPIMSGIHYKKRR